MKLYPLKFIPIYFDKIWGGDKIKTYFKRNVRKQNVGESWEIIHNEKYQSIIENGSLQGKSIIDVFTPEIMGETVSKKFKSFPLIIKYLDANDDLSVQVHPSKKAGANETKNEIWYFIDAPSSGKIVAGVNETIHSGNIINSLKYLEIQKDSAVFIPSGAVHALTKNSFVLEIQETLDITYRLYDWDRLNPDGTPRELHFDTALKHVDNSINVDELKCKISSIEKKPGYEIFLIIDCEYFTIKKWVIKETFKAESLKSSFSILSLINGKARILYSDGEITLSIGENILIPARLGEYSIKGNCEIIHTNIT